MEIVIDIDENVFTRLFDNGIQDNEIAVDDVCEMARALRLGTPLPKGYGRLIDADAYLAKERPRGIADDTWKESHIYKSMIGAPTIIEADKERSDK